MGSDKHLLEYQGKSLLQHSVDLVSRLPVFERILVTSEARQRHILLPSDVQLCINPYPEAGQSSSIKIGIEAATGTHYLFLPSDQPKLTVDDILPLLEATKANPDKIICPYVYSKPKKPAIFPDLFKNDLKLLTGDNGGKTVRNANKVLCYCLHTENPDNFKDIDTLEDYIALKRERTVTQ